MTVEDELGETRVPGLASEMRDVVELAVRPDQVDEFLDRALEALEESFPYDLAAFLQRREGTLEVRAVRGRLAVPSLKGRRLDPADHPPFRRALERRRPELARTRADAGDPWAGAVDLPADHSMLVVPVLAGPREVGLLTFDGERQDTYPAETVPIASMYGHLIGLGVVAAEQARALEAYRESLEERNRLLVEEVEGDADACRSLERLPSRSMRRLVGMAKQVAITDAPVLITGETGTGKEVFARAIHGWSRRAEGPFIALNCAALPEGLIESELFGHRKGAFSGADRDRPGRFRLADGGTLLLDEVGDLPAATQIKLLRVLQEGMFEPVGGDEVLQVDVRILAATNTDLEAAIVEGSFREDLFYRLNVFPLLVPPLRDHREDLAALTETILERLRRQTGRGPWTVPEDVLSRMTRYDWPGNVRELVNVLERARVYQPVGGELQVELPARTRPRRRRATAGERWPTLKEHEKEYIERVLERTGGKIYGDDGAAKLLEMPPTTLQSRMARLGISRKRRR